MKKNSFVRILSFIHLVFFLSVFCFGTIYFTFGILAIPALAAAFSLGKGLIYDTYNVYDSVFKDYLDSLKNNMHMMKYFPLELLLVLQIIGIRLLTSDSIPLEQTTKQLLSYCMLACAAFVLTLAVYLCVYHVTYEQCPKLINVIIAMLYKQYCFLPIWIANILIICYMSLTLAVILLFLGAAVLIVYEAVAFIDIMLFRKLKGELTEEEIQRWPFLDSRHGKTVS